MTTENAIAEYSVTTAALAKLKTELAGKVYAVDNATGMALAKFDRRGLVTLRTDLEKKRKEIKAPALAHCALIDNEAKRITLELRALEDPIDAQIGAQEAIEEAKRAEKARIAAEAQLKLDGMIAEISRLPQKCVRQTAADISIFLATLEARPFGAEFAGDTLIRAEVAKSEAVTEIRKMLVDAEWNEAEAARVEAERVESDRLATIQREQMAAQQAELAEQKRLQDIENEKALLLKNIQSQIDYLNSIPIDAFNNSLNCEQITALLIELDAYECNGHAAVIVALEFNINRLQSLFDRVKADAEANRKQAEIDRQMAAIDAENKRIADEAAAAQREIERQAAIVAEAARKKAEIERKAAEKALKLEKAKCADAATAFKKILAICQNTEEPETAIEDIATIAEAML